MRTSKLCRMLPVLALALATLGASACGTRSARKLDHTRYYWLGSESAGLGCIGHKEIGARLEQQDCFADLPVDVEVRPLELSSTAIAELAGGTPLADAARAGRARAWELRVDSGSMIRALHSDPRIAQLRAVEDSAVGSASTITAIVVLVDVEHAWTKMVAWGSRRQVAVLDDRGLTIAGHAAQYVPVAYDLGTIVWGDRERTSIHSIEPDPVGRRRFYR